MLRRSRESYATWSSRVIGSLRKAASNVPRVEAGWRLRSTCEFEVISAAHHRRRTYCLGSASEHLMGFESGKGFRVSV